MQDDLLNQMRNFMQNFQNGPPGEDKEHEVTTDTELPSTEDIQPLPVQEPPQKSDICQLIREECFVEVPEEQKQNIEKTMLDLEELFGVVMIDIPDNSSNDPLLEEVNLFLSDDSIPPESEDTIFDPGISD
nr:hypothetical protein [Tanacetum cinerariifolium]